MFLRTLSRKFAAFAIIAALTCLTAGAQTSPEAFLGHRVGADRKLADYGQIKAYFEKLDAESPKLQLLTIGESTLGKPMIMAVITSEANMGRLDRYQGDHPSIEGPQGPFPRRGREAGRGRQGHRPHHLQSPRRRDRRLPDVHGIRLRSRHRKDALRRDKVLEDVIVLLVPTSNPDGHQMECEWYAKNLGTKYEGGNMPWIYHPYAGHDNNRDWFMFNLSGDAGHHQGPLSRVVPPDPHGRAPDGKRRRPAVRPALHEPARPERPAARLAGRQPLRGQHGLRPAEERLSGRRPRPELHGLVDRGLRRHGLAPQHPQPSQRSGLGQPRDPHLYRAHRDLEGILREAHGVPRPVAGRLVEAPGHRGL